MTELWQPLSERRTAGEASLTAEVPSYLYAPLQGWLYRVLECKTGRVMVVRPGHESTLTREVMIRLHLSGPVPWFVEATNPRFLDAIDAALYWTDWKFRGLGLDDREDLPVDLEQILKAARFPWRVSDSFQALEPRERLSASTVVAPALSALPNAAAIAEHLKRLVTNVDTDPRLAVSVAKDLVESTAKLVLRERKVSYTGREDLPVLVARAQHALRLNAAGVPGTTEEAKALKTILGSLSRLTQGVTELRNQVGVGHGRESVPTWVRPRHARLAAGAATTWCNLMLETLGDPDAPWRA